ncbi:MAG: S1 RNA-binding domain-containing protein [Myxococcaceae bacterium]|nr:S1 RNA-binding domain-containing protein [Myxococcaceae bacterium]
MANDSQGNSGRKKAFPKTFGDVMKGIPAGQGQGGREGRQESGQGNSSARPRADRDARVGPVVVRKPSLKIGGTAPTEAAASASPRPEATSGASTDVSGARAVAHPPRAPKTVFRRAEGVNLPAKMPTAAEIEQRLAAMPAVEDESFAELFAASGTSRVGLRTFEVGQKVSGRVVQITGERAFLDLGGKGEGMIELSELKDKNGDLLVAVGEVLDAFVLSTGGGITLTKALTKGAQREFLQEACQAGIPVEGSVVAVNKGGFEIDLGGGARGFCPVSQIDNRYVEDTSAFVGQRLNFRVVEIKERDIVLSRRALLEAEQAARVEALREQIVPGAQFDGVVSGLRDFGAFVDLGGVEGMVHVSELSFGRVAHPSEVLEVGQKVRVEVLRVEPPKAGQKGLGRVALSMKSLMADPWIEATSSLKEGERVSGTVVRLQPFGAFVELMPGVDGLIHISALGASRRVAHPGEVVSEGERVECVIESIDQSSRRVALRRLTGDESIDFPAVETALTAASEAPKVGDSVEVTVDKVEPFGLFVTFSGGRGLVPNAEMGTPRGTDHRKLFPSGTTFQAEIIERDAQGRLRLSKIAAEKSEERREVARYLKSEERTGASKGFGTFADLFNKANKAKKR